MDKIRAIKVLKDQTADEVANTETTVAHGLTDAQGRPMTPTIVLIQPHPTKADTVAETVLAHVVSFDDTEVTFKANAASAEVDIISIYLGDFVNFPG